MEIKTSEFFMNMKSLPEKGTPEYKQLIKWEEEKCLSGINVNGIHIPGWLYFHLNHWHIRIDLPNGQRPLSLPYLRDNEWERAEHFEKCKKEGKGYIEIGRRQAGKSEYEASVCGYTATLIQNSQNVIVGNSVNDINLMKDKISTGLSNMWKGLYIPRLDKTWRGDQIRLGYKDKKNEDVVWSYIYIRNSNDGTNTEVAAGTTASSFIFDEVGKANCANVYAAAKEAFIGEFGLRAVPILVGTGGSFDRGKDAENMFLNPEAEGFLGVKNDDGRITGLFMGGWMRSDFKKWMSLGDYLTTKGVQLSEREELDKIQIKVADKEFGIRTLLEERELKRKSPDQETYLKAIMYNPLTVEECFLTLSNNIFNVKAAKQQQERIVLNGIKSQNVFLKHDGEKIVHEYTDKLPISKFPHSNTSDLDAPVCIWEHPIKDVEFGLYCAGVDSYKFDETSSDSLGAVYIYKREHDLMSETMQGAIVASYVARPEKKEKWSEQARFLIKYYNAYTLIENDEPSFIEYMKAKGDERYLAEQPNWIKSQSPNSITNRRTYGVSRNVARNRKLLDTALKDYLDETILEEKDEEGSVIKEILGVHQVLDFALLEEIIKFNNDGNFDRVVAVELAIGLAKSLDPLYKAGSSSSDIRLKEYFTKKSSRALFQRNNSLFKNNKRRLF